MRVWRAIVDLSPHGTHFGLQPLVLEKCGRCVLIFSAASGLEAFAGAAAASDRLSRVEPIVTRHSNHRLKVVYDYNTRSHKSARDSARTHSETSNTCSIYVYRRPPRGHRTAAPAATTLPRHRRRWQRLRPSQSSGLSISSLSTS